MIDFTNYGLGRIASTDVRDKLYHIGSVLPQLKKAPLPRDERYWNANGWWGNQKQTNTCVGFMWAHFIEDGPVTHKGQAPIVNPFDIYTGAQDNDEWEGTNYEGTSVRGAAKWLQARGVIGNYYWGWDIDTMLYVLFNIGPVAMGIDWHLDMFEPDPETHLIKATGPVMGGHAVLANGGSLKREQIRIKNSWGRDWGNNGHAWISFADMEKLINNQGEICLAVENKIIQPG